MENKKIKVTVIVAGQRFNILTDKGEKYVRDIASQIDARINSMCISGEMTREKAAVLTALDYADDSMLDRENLAAVKEQVKDYLRDIEKLRDNNAKLNDDYMKLKAEYERLIADNRTVAEMEAEAENYRSVIAGLEAKVNSLNEEIEALKSQPVQDDMAVEDMEAPPEKEEPVITAEDDLFFDEEEQVKPLPKKKNRHEHKHENPYKKKAENAKEQKGYTQQRQYTFFDINEE